MPDVELYSHLVPFAGGKYGTGFRPSPFMVAQGGPLTPPAVCDPLPKSHIVLTWCP